MIRLVGSGAAACFLPNSLECTPTAKLNRLRVDVDVDVVVIVGAVVNVNADTVP